ncbi:phage tail tape measure protein [Lactococcus garvieae]|nr:phage tail tape measure protein [Lactococcus garvieae]
MADTPLGKMIIEMGLDDANFSKGITGVNKQLSALKNDLKTSQTSFKTFGKGMEDVRSPIEILNKSIAKQKEQIDLLKKSYDGSIIDGKATSSTQNYANQISRANSQLAQYQSQLKAAAIEQYKQTSILPKISSGFGKVSSGLDSVASKTAPISVGITAAFAKSIKAATDFNGQMTEIRALLSDGTPTDILSKQMDVLADKSKKWAQQYGIDTSSINEGMEEMIKRGYDFNQTVGAMPSVLDAARASGDDFGTVMSSSTAILEQFGLKTNDTTSMMKNTQRVTDSLTFVANKTSAGFSDMGTAMEYVGPVAHALNISLEETSAAIGLLSNNGIEGDKAGTALRGALTRLLKPTKESSLAFKQLGVNLDEWKKGNIGLPDMLDTIKHSTEGMTDAEKSSLIAKAFGTQAQTGMNILIEQGGEALRNLTKETQNATGYTKKLADQMNNSDKNAFNRAKATLETLSISLGEKLLPSIIPIVKEVDNLASSFEKLDPKTQQLIIKMALTAAAVAPTAKALSGLTRIVSGTTGMLAKLGARRAGELALKGIATEATVASTAIGAGGRGLAGSISGLTPILSGIGPVGWTAISVLGAAGLAGVIWKLTEGIREQEAETKKWGVVVGQEASGKLDVLNEKFVKVTSAAEDFDSRGSQALGNVKKAIDELGGVATDSISEMEKALEKGGSKAGLTDKQLAESKKGFEEQKNNVKLMTDKISQIYEAAAQRNGELSNLERSIIQENQQAIIKSTLENYGITGNKAVEVMKAFTGRISDMNNEALKQSSESIKKMMNDEAKAYEAAKISLKTALESKGITQEEYDKKIEALNKAHYDTLEKYGEDYINIKREQQKRESEGAKNNARLISNIRQKYNNEIRQSLKKLGLDYDELTKKMGESGKKGAKDFGDSAHLIAKYSTNMSKDAKEAADMWNTMIFDKKTGEIKTNAKEVIQDTIKTPEGWEQMKFITKEANLTTNARKTIVEALQANGQWEQLTPEEKQLVIGNNVALFKLYSSKESLKEWNNLPAKQKELWAKDSTKAGVEAAQATMNTLKDVERLLKSKNLTGAEKEKAQATMNSLKDVQRVLTAKNSTLPEKIKAQNTMNSLRDVVRNLQASNLTGPGVAAANSFIDRNFKGKTAILTADSSEAFRVQDAFITTPASKTIQLIASTTHNAQGTPYHPGGLAMVNDQKGPTYKELITLPNGVSFVPQGRDVLLPLPKGSKVLKASQTAKLIPKYAGGVGGVPKNAEIFQKMDEVQQQVVVNTPKVNDDRQLVLLREILQALLQNGTNNNVVEALEEFSKRPVIGIFDIQDITKKIAPLLTKEQAKNNLINKLIEGRNP